MQQQQERQRQQMEMKKRQEEMMRKQQEEQRQKQEQMRREQQAAMAIRNLVQKLRNSNPETHQAVKAEVQQVLGQHLQACGSQAAKIQMEVQNAMSAAEEHVKQILEKRRQDEEKRKE